MNKHSEQETTLPPVQIDQLLNQSVDLIISCDLDGYITEFNRAAEKTLGYTRDEILGQHISIISGKSEEEVIKQLSQTGIYVGEVVNRKKDGSKYLAFLSANLLYDNKGNPIGSMGVSRDISKQKEKEQQYSNT